jgi:hypothetical protein
MMIPKSEEMHAIQNPAKAPRIWTKGMKMVELELDEVSVKGTEIKLACPKLGASMASGHHIDLRILKQLQWMQKL